MKMNVFVSGGQRFGTALMLPVSVLPVAGILLRLGQPDLLNIKVAASAGAAIFSYLPLLDAGRFQLHEHSRPAKP
jgi:PTS system N-acetylglucosamine-specific IIC component